MTPSKTSPSYCDVTVDRPPFSKAVYRGAPCWLRRRPAVTRVAARARDGDLSAGQAHRPKLPCSSVLRARQCSRLLWVNCTKWPFHVKQRRDVSVMRGNPSPGERGVVPLDVFVRLGYIRSGAEFRPARSMDDTSPLYCRNVGPIVRPRFASKNRSAAIATRMVNWNRL